MGPGRRACRTHPTGAPSCCTAKRKITARAVACTVEPRGGFRTARFGVLIYPVHAITRKSLGDMTRKLSVTESHRFAQLRGTVSRRKPSVASANWVHVA